MTIVFRNWNSKHPNKAFLVLNLRIIKCIIRSFIMLNAMMTIKTQVLLIFPSLSWDHVHSLIFFIMKLIAQINIFKFNNVYFCTKLCNYTNFRTLIGTDGNLGRQIIAQKYQKIMYFWSQIWGSLQLDKFKGADFKYDNSFSKFQHKTPKWGIFKQV